jgi:hypothetical protein
MQSEPVESHRTMGKKAISFRNGVISISHTTTLPPNPFPNDLAKTRISQHRLPFLFGNPIVSSVKSSVFGGKGLPHEFQQRLHFLHTKPVLMFLNQHMQRRQRPRHRIHNHQLFHFGEFVVPDRVEERGDLLRCLQRDMRSLERKVILQLPRYQGSVCWGGGYGIPRVGLSGGCRAGLLCPFVCGRGLRLCRRVCRLRGLRGSLRALGGPALLAVVLGCACRGAGGGGAFMVVRLYPSGGTKDSGRPSEEAAEICVLAFGAFSSGADPFGGSQRLPAGDVAGSLSCDACLCTPEKKSQVSALPATFGVSI